MVNNHGPWSVSPQRMGVVGPRPNGGCSMAELNGGDPKHLNTNWDDPPSRNPAMLLSSAMQMFAKYDLACTN